MSEFEDHKLVDYTEGSSPLVVERPHGGRRIIIDPRTTNIGNVRIYGPEAKQTFIMGVDNFPRFIKVGSEHATVTYDCPRIFSDPNRGVKVARDASEIEVDKYAVIGGSETEIDANGFIWRARPKVNEESVVDIITGPLTPEAFRKHVENTGMLHYQHEIIRRAQAAKEKHGFACIIGLHSIPPYSVKRVGEEDVEVGNYHRRHFGTYVMGEKFEEFESPDVVLITDGGASCPPEVIDLVVSTLVNNNFIVFPGVGALDGSIGSTRLYPNEDPAFFSFGLEYIAHGGLESGRLEGKFTPPDEKQLAVIQSAQDEMFNELEKLKQGDLSAPEGSSSDWIARHFKHLPSK